MNHLESQQDKLRGLGSVRVAKKFLVDKLKQNRKEHEKAYQQVLEARHVQVMANLRAELKKVKDDIMYHPSFYVALPENHVKDYDRNISMLEASLDSEFELTSNEFNQYVNDDWSWKTGFATVSGCYISPNKLN